MSVLPRRPQHPAPAPSAPPGVVAAAALWAALLAGVLALPSLTSSPTPGDDLTRNTVRLALGYYAAAVGLMLVLRPAEWAVLSGRVRLARACWTLAWAAYLVHLGMAFHHYHGWSHADAVAHTRQVSGVGEGIYVSHLFTVLWTADVVWWWLRPAGYARRPPWVGRALHGFMLFMVFCATVVYEAGPVRWAGVLLFACLAALAVWRRSHFAATRG
jgi:hypothetical protein